MDNRTIKVINGFTHKYYTHVVDNAQFYQTIVAGDKANDLSEAINIAAGAIDSGAARKKLEEVKEVSNKL